MTSPLWMFFPEELLPFLLVAAGFLMILGQRKLAGSLFLLAIVLAFLPVLLAPLMDTLPLWILLLGLAVFGVAAASAALGWILRLLFGKQVAPLVLAHLIAGMIEKLAAGVWWATRSITLLIWRGLTAMIGR